jgi:type III polyketide synthase
VISKDVPKHIESSLCAGFEDLIGTTPSLQSSTNFKASDYDWALHPGGYGILVLAQQVLNISKQHLRKSYDVYQKRGNTSSATILSVINKLAGEECTTKTGRDKVVVASFGPGITMEMVVMARPT